MSNIYPEYIDANIRKKIQAHQMQHKIIMYHNQIGIIMDTLDWFNIQIFNTIHHINKQEKDSNLHVNRYIKSF